VKGVHIVELKMGWIYWLRTLAISSYHVQSSCHAVCSPVHVLQVRKLVVALSLAIALIGCVQVHVTEHTSEVAGHGTPPHGRYEVVNAHGQPFSFCPTYEQAVYQVLYWHDGLRIVEVSPTSSWDL